LPTENPDDPKNVSGRGTLQRAPTEYLLRFSLQCFSPNSELITPNFKLLIPNSELITPNSKLLIPQFAIQKSY